MTAAGCFYVAAAALFYFLGQATSAKDVQSHWLLPLAAALFWPVSIGVVICCVRYERRMVRRMAAAW